MQNKILQRVFMQGISLWRSGVFIHSQVDLFPPLPRRHDAKILPGPCGGDPLRSPAGRRDRFGCVSSFPHFNAQPPEEGNKSSFRLSRDF